VIPLLGAQRVPESIFRSSQKYCFAVQDACEHAMMAVVRRAEKNRFAQPVSRRWSTLNSKANGKIAASGLVKKLSFSPLPATMALHWVPRSLRISI